jgi:hypothetical protein
MGPGGNTTCNQPSDIWNKYVPGAGVGATTIAIRRFKTIRATSCDRCHFTKPLQATHSRYTNVYKDMFQSGQNSPTFQSDL